MTEKKNVYDVVLWKRLGDGVEEFALVDMVSYGQGKGETSIIDTAIVNHVGISSYDGVIRLRKIANRLNGRLNGTRAEAKAEMEAEGHTVVIDDVHWAMLEALSADGKEFLKWHPLYSILQTVGKFSGISTDDIQKDIEERFSPQALVQDTIRAVYERALTK